MSICERATVVFLRDGEGRICLAQKKQDIHKANGEVLKKSNRWNGYGGKCEGKEFLATAVDELFFEAGVRANQSDLELVGRIHFFWPMNKSGHPDMDVCFFFLDRFIMTPVETAEMGPPRFFEGEEIPYQDMMPADCFFLPLFLKGEKLTGRVRFRTGNSPLFE